MASGEASKLQVGRTFAGTPSYQVIKPNSPRDLLTRFFGANGWVNHLSLSPKSKSLFEHRDLHSLHSLRDLVGKFFFGTNQLQLQVLLAHPTILLIVILHIKLHVAWRQLMGNMTRRVNQTLHTFCLSARVTSHNT